MARLRRQLVERLVADGALRSEEWRGAFAAVPRHHFVPSFFRKEEGGEGGDAGDGWRSVAAGESGYGEGVYTDTSLATQLTDGVPTSSSSQPGLMALMLEALDVRDGHRVLEVATGTGYNAALLSERLGSESVTSVEVDPRLAQRAREKLRTAGYRPAVRTGDGRAGHEGGAPYDRLIATCGFASIPYAWIRQVRPGGVLVVPLGLANVRLVVSGDGRSARGHFLPGGAYFMSVREAGATGVIPRPAALATLAAALGEEGGGSDQVPCESASLTPEVLTDRGFRFVLALALPDVTGRAELGDEGELTAFELWDSAGAWARVDMHGGTGPGSGTRTGSGPGNVTGSGSGPGTGSGGEPGSVGEDGEVRRTVRQSGPRRLWDAVEHIHHWYEQAGSPAQTRFGLTVTESGGTVWLDDPSARVPLPEGT